MYNFFIASDDLKFNSVATIHSIFSHYIFFPLLKYFCYKESCRIIQNRIPRFPFIDSALRKVISRSTFVLLNHVNKFTFFSNSMYIYNFIYINNITGRLCIFISHILILIRAFSMHTEHNKHTQRRSLNLS